MTIRQIYAADLFCGAGGTSSGLFHACESMGITVDLVAINHWTVAIETHRANHPEARHICANLENIDPRQAVPSGRLDLLVASPECTHHSVARGGKPVCDQLRASAWHILRWVELLQVENVLLENVREFRDWGPTDMNGKPIKSRKGETYRAFLGALRSMNYTVEDRVLNAADYGDPTSRRRLFIQARRGKKRIAWPVPTHGNATPYRTAREIIDWNLPGESIFTRKRPLSKNTLARIAAGLRKYGGENAEPFLVMLYGTGTSRSVDRPMPTVTANGQHVGLCEPFLVSYHNHQDGKENERRTHSVQLPLPTLDTSNRYGLVEPFLIHTNHEGGRRVHDVDEPLPTVTCGHRGEMALIEPFVLGQQSCSAPRSVDEPLPTIATAGAIALIEPFLIPNFGERDGQDPRTHSDNEPLPTVTGHGAGALVQPFIVPIDNAGNGERGAKSVDAPLGTVITQSRFGLCEPFIAKYYGTGTAQGIDKPLDTITTKARFGLVEPVGLDIRFRMLQPHELAAAMSFDSDYKFKGNKTETIKQIGNAVPVMTAAALCRELLRN